MAIPFTFFLCASTSLIVECLQGTCQVLIDLLVSNSSLSAAPQTPAASDTKSLSAAEGAGCADIGLTQLRPQELQSRTLAAVMLLLKHREEYLYLGKHAFPVCLSSFVEYVQTSMDRYSQTGNISPGLADLRPYFALLGKLLVLLL